MKKLISSILILSMLFTSYAFTVPVSAAAKADNIDYVDALYFESAPTVDGYISNDEWGEYSVFVEALDCATIDDTCPYSRFFYNRISATNMDDYGSFYYYIWLRWSEEYFYIGVKVHDPDVHSLKNGTTNTWNGDAVMTRIDKAGANAAVNGGNFTVTADRQKPWSTNLVPDFLFGYTEIAGGFTEAWENNSNKGMTAFSNNPLGTAPAVVAPAGSDYSADTRSGYTTYEVAIPWTYILNGDFDSLTYTEYKTGRLGNLQGGIGREFGMSLAVMNDGNDANAGWDAYISWGSGICQTHQTEGALAATGSNAVTLSATPVHQAAGYQTYDPTPLLDAKFSQNNIDDPHTYYDYLSGDIYRTNKLYNRDDLYTITYDDPADLSVWGAPEYYGKIGVDDAEHGNVLDYRDNGNYYNEIEGYYDGATYIDTRDGDIQYLFPTSYTFEFDIKYTDIKMFIEGYEPALYNWFGGATVYAYQCGYFFNDAMFKVVNSNNMNEVIAEYPYELEEDRWYNWKFQFDNESCTARLWIDDLTTETDNYQNGTPGEPGYTCEWGTLVINTNCRYFYYSTEEVAENGTLLLFRMMNTQVAYDNVKIYNFASPEYIPLMPDIGGDDSESDILVTPPDPGTDIWTASITTAPEFYNASELTLNVKFDPYTCFFNGIKGLEEGTYLIERINEGFCKIKIINFNYLNTLTSGEKYFDIIMSAPGVSSFEELSFDFSYEYTYSDSPADRTHIFSTHVSLYEYGEPCYIPFIPEVTAEYAFYSDTDRDTFGLIYNSYWEQIASNDDGGNDYNFKVSATLQAGQKYYLAARYYDSGYTGTFDVHLEKCPRPELPYPTIELNTTTMAEITSDGGYSYFVFIPTSSGNYTFTSDTSSDTYGYICDEYDNILIADDDSGHNTNFSVNYYLYAGTRYILKSRFYSNEAGSFPVIITYSPSYSSNGEFEYINYGDHIIITDWYSNAETLIIPSDIDGVPVTGVTQFSSNSHTVKSIIIPDTVETVGDSFFQRYSNLRTVSLGSGIRNLTPYMFAYCYSLQSIMVSDANPYYTVIDGVLYDEHITSFIALPRATVTSILIPKTCVDISGLDYYGNIELNFEEGHAYFVTIDGVTYNKDMTKVEFCSKDYEGDYVMPDTVTEINPKAFYDIDGLTSVVVSKQVTEIVYYTFASCKNLKSVELPTGLVSIGESVFRDTPVLDGIVLPDTLQNIDTRAFYSSGITSIAIPDSCQRISYNAFTHSNIQTLDLGEGIVEIDSSAFMYTPVEAVVIPDSLTTLGSDAFYCCENLKSLTIGAGLEYINSSTFAETAIESVVFPETLRYIGHGAFAYSGLRNIEFQNPAIELGNFAFAYCPLDALVLGDEMTEIPYYAFTGTNIKVIDIPESVTRIVYGAFSSCEELSDISIPENVVEVGGHTFDGTEWYNSHSNGLMYLDHALYSWKGIMPAGTSLTVREGTTILADYVLEDQVNLSAITLPQSLEIIGDYAFYRCYSLKSIHIPANVRLIGDSVFSGCKSLTKITVDPDNKYYYVEDGILYSYDGYAIYDTNATYEISEVWIHNFPNKCTYKIGEKLDTTGMALGVRYGSGFSEIITDDFASYGIEFRGFNSSISGGRNVEVYYNDVCIGGFWIDVYNDGSISPDTPAATISGDIDGDGIVSGKDSFLLKCYLCGVISINTDAADVYYDGSVDSKDANMLIRLIVSGSDMQKVPPEISDYFGVSPDDYDSDYDGLSNYVEIFITRTSPTQSDSDYNGICDADEDADGDWLGNAYEIYIGTDPVNPDSDEDGLNDYEEIYVTFTKALIYDTDNDGISDGDEVDLGLDPLTQMSDGSTPDSERSFTQELSEENISEYLISEDNAAIPSLTVTSSGNINSSVSIVVADDNKFSDSRAVIGEPIEIIGDSIEEGTITFTLTDTATSYSLADSIGYNTNLICKYNDNGTTEYLETYFDSSDNTLSAEVTGEGTYFVLDVERLFDELGLEMPTVTRTRSISGKASVPTGSASVKAQADVVFIIDTTGSMSDEINNVKNNIQYFVDALTEKGISSALALIDYQDLKADGYDSTRVHKNGSSNWFYNIDDYKTAISNLSLGYGGDTPECAVDALETARLLDMRASAGKIFVLVTDADYKVDNRYGIPSMDAEIELLKNAEVTCAVVSTSSDKSVYNDLYTETGGIWADIYGNFYNQLMELADKLGDDLVGDGYWIYLDGPIPVPVRLDEKPREGSTVDTDKDGIPDVVELEGAVPSGKINLDELLTKVSQGVITGTDYGTVMMYKYTSDPSEKDSDGDGYADKSDKNPKKWNISDRDLAMCASMSYSFIPTCAALDHLSSALTDEINDRFDSTAILKELGRWSVVDTWYADGGLQAVAFKVDSNIVVAYRGTDEGVDWFNDATTYILGLSSHTPAAKKFMKKIVNKYKDCDVYVTGHSLGGHLAYNAAAEGISRDKAPIKGIVTFNGLGLTLGLTLFGDVWDESQLLTKADVIRNYSVEGDPVSQGFLGFTTFHYGTTYVYNQSAGAPSAHSMYTFLEQLEPTARYDYYQ